MSIEAELMAWVVERNPGELEFHQAVHEWLESVAPVVEAHPDWLRAKILHRMVEPERVVSFRVTWTDDAGQVQVNRGYRIQMSSVLGPYKGGLRFRPSVTPSVLKFLAFEQVFKNSLTTLSLGGGKGGADFDPKGRSDAEVMRFCQAFMTELWRHIGAETDVPAGDIGVGGREIGYLFGQYKRLANRFDGTLTGKSPDWGGSLLRPEATGYGATWFAQEMLAREGDGLDGKRVVVSGAGNVAQYAIEQLLACGARVVTVSDSSGTVLDEAGLDTEKLDWVKRQKNEVRGSLREYVQRFPAAVFLAGARPWDVPCDLAMPCATQNEIEAVGAGQLARNGCRLVVEGSNMSTDAAGSRILREAGVLHAPGKAANAGGVATSGLEMSQNGQRMPWTRQEVEERLREIMRRIHSACVEHGQVGSHVSPRVDYVRGANVAGFLRVARSMMDQGLV